MTIRHWRSEEELAKVIIDYWHRQGYFGIEAKVVDQVQVAEGREITVRAIVSNLDRWGYPSGGRHKDIR